MANKNSDCIVGLAIANCLLKNIDITKMNHKTWHKASKVQQEPFKIKSHVSGGTNLNKFPFLCFIPHKRAIAQNPSDRYRLRCILNK